MTSRLRFRPDKTFTIVQFTDLHWQNADEPDMKTRALMEAVLDAEKPDLVVLTGDVIDGKGCKDPAGSWRQAVASIEARELPWAAVFGNHDDEGSLSRAQLMEVQRTCQFCLSDAGPAEITGVGNYTLPVLAAEQDSPEAVLYFIDSRSYAPAGMEGYGWVATDQVGWFRQTSRELNAAYSKNKMAAEARLPALAFFHIPLPEYNEVWDSGKCVGSKYEPVASPRVNSGLFVALYEAGDVMGTFVGHDHVNDFEGTLYGIRLCYGRGTGYNTYGREGFPCGGRVIRLEEGKRDFTTWHRLEGGSALSLSNKQASE